MPFTSGKHEATDAAHVVFGVVKAGRVLFANDADKSKVGR